MPVALVIGLALVASMGVAHHFALRGLELLSGYDRRNPNWTILGVFMGLLALHTAEILAWAAAYGVLLSLPAFDWLGGLSGPAYSGGWGDLVYFSGIQFTSLGYTSITTDGPVRLISLMQSLGGFMVLTWSATYIYSAWQRAFRTAWREQDGQTQGGQN